LVELFVCGDIVNYKNTDGLVCSNSLSKIISNADYSICNFEAPVEGVGTPILKAGPHHYQRAATVRGLKQQGFDLMCLANNHMLDYGAEALEKTIEIANEEGLETIGAGMNFKEAYEPLIKVINNIKIGFINVCEAQFGVIDYFSDADEPGYGWINHSEVDKQVIKLNQICDFVIVLAHAGLEHYSIPQKEWRYRYRHLSDLGADLVIGSHPHVPQGYEYHNDSLIFYSLGNFYFDSKNYINKEERSYSLLINLKHDGTLSFKPVFHYKKDLKVCLAPDEKKVDLQSLTDYLGEEYEKLHDKMALEVYNKRLKRNLIYSLVPIPYDGTILFSIKRIINRLLMRVKKQDKNISALHLIRNETYHNVFKHALELISKENMGED